MNGVSTDFQEEQVIEITKSKVIYNVIKRVFDIILSFISIILLSPLFLLIAVLIKLDSKGKVFYKHKRIGKNGEYIYLYKFRSMYSDSKERLEEMLKDSVIRKEWEENYKLDHDPRITKVGAMLRKTSLDELPQLFNILKGDLSLIGPRPVVEDELKKYGTNTNKFLSVTPGLTGFWAANGRSCTSYEQRMQMELFYIDNFSFKMDVKVFFKTISAVLKREGAV